MIKSEFVSFVASNVSDLISNGKYEPFICDLMNRSVLVFESRYVHIESQTKGEPDYIDLASREKFDVKLILSTKQGEDLCSKNKNISDYSNWIAEINNELYFCVTDFQNHKIEDTIIFNLFIRLINKIKPDENLIVLFTYPFMNVCRDSISDFFLVDYMDIIYASLKQHFIDRKLYVIYPTLDNFIVLRRMSDNKKEFLRSDDINQFFSVRSVKIIK